MRASDWSCSFTGAPGITSTIGLAECEWGLPRPGVGQSPDCRATPARTSIVGSVVSDGVDGDPDVLRLRRIAHHLIRLGEHKESDVIPLPAFVVRQLGVILHRIADRLEGRP